MLIAAIIFFALLSVMLGFFLNYAAAEINRLETQLTAAQGQVAYWQRQQSNSARRYFHTAKGLQDVLKLRTNVMANVGSRMSRIAQLALEAAQNEPFNKD